MFQQVATIKSLSSGACSLLASRHLVGRSRSCHLRIASPSVSGLHAEIVWDDQAWSIQDLGSRNGTFVDGKKLAAGEQALLSCGSEVTFGVSEHRFRLIDASPPSLMAMADSGDVQLAEGEIMCLPNVEVCEVTIFPDRYGVWRIETAREEREVEDQELVVAGGIAWRVCLPAPDGRTCEAIRSPAAGLDDVSLSFFVSRDGEYIRMTLAHGSGSVDFGSRVHAGLLLTLARCRMNDANTLPKSEVGWVHREDLAKMLAISDGHLINLWVYRARRQFAELGIRGAAGIVERREGTQQMRIGIADLNIQDA